MVNTHPAARIQPAYSLGGAVTRAGLIVSAASLVVCVALFEMPHLVTSMNLPLVGAAGALILLSITGVGVALIPLLTRMDQEANDVRITIRTGCLQQAALFETSGIEKLSQRRLSDGRQLLRFRMKGRADDCLPKVLADVTGVWHLVKRGRTFQFAFAPQCDAEDYMFSLSLVPAAGKAQTPSQCSGYSRLMPRTLLLAA